MNEIPKHELLLRDNLFKIVLYDRLDPKIFSDEEAARNVYKLDFSGNIIWQVSSKSDERGAPFTGIRIDEDGKLMAYRWDGGLYEIDIETGFATPKILMRF